MKNHSKPLNRHLKLRFNRPCHRQLSRQDLRKQKSTEHGRVGVIATVGTVGSGAYQRAVADTGVAVGWKASEGTGNDQDHR